MSDPVTSPFTMVGASDAAVCEGDACLVPLTADEAAAASARAVTAALDEGASL